MVWEPFLLAIGFGLAVSAGIYFAILWPQVEPLDDDELAAQAAAAAEPAAEPAAAAPPSATSETGDDAVP
jgi:hypothetical protein